MKTRFTHLLAGASGLALAALGAGCLADETEDPEQIASALEEENGGLTTEDEAPMFGAEEDFEAAALGDEAIYQDAMESDEAVAIMLELPDAVVARVQIMWGQLPPDGDPDPRNWSGRIRVNRGALLVRRTIAFDPVTDRVLPRNDPRSVEFTSMTAPHMDGLLLTVVDPEPENTEPLTLIYSRPEGDLYSARLSDLRAGPVVTDMADGNRMAGIAMARPVDACDHGFLRGRWRQVAPRHGVLHGVVADADGNRIGHMRGIWGHRRNGEQVFFGKYIDRDGRFRGIFGGHYRDGEFRGRWLTRAGEHGVLGGGYRESLPGPRHGGHFAGRWAETSCNLDIPPDL